MRRNWFDRRSRVPAYVVTIGLAQIGEIFRSMVWDRHIRQGDCARYLFAGCFVFEISSICFVSWTGLSWCVLCTIHVYKTGPENIYLYIVEVTKQALLSQTKLIEKNTFWAASTMDLANRNAQFSRNRFRSFISSWFFRIMSFVLVVEAHHRKFASYICCSTAWNGKKVYLWEGKAQVHINRKVVQCMIFSYREVPSDHACPSWACQIFDSYAANL